MADEKENSNSELMQLTQEAFKLASTACHFDKLGNYVGACDYYDKSLLNMDEVLNKLHPDSPEWKKLYDIRTKYDDRMEFLRDNDTSNFSLTSLALGKTESKPSGQKLPRNRRKLSDAETDFKDIDWSDASQENAPDDTVEVTYWLLRNIRKTMDQGGFLTKDVFVPKRIWQQTDVKFSGLAAKMAAFDIIIKLVTNHTDALYFSLDEDSLDLADAAFAYIYEELTALQNNLSKPFPYIKELNMHANKEEVGADAATGLSTSSKPHGRSGTLSSFVSSFGKNVRKYAEVGFQRLVVALPTKLTAEELEEYTAVVTKLCDKCQVLSTWYEYISKAQRAQQQSFADSSYTPPTAITAQDAVAATESSAEVSTEASDAGMEAPSAKPREPTKIDTIRTSLVSITASLRDIVVEILFRDLEYLLDKYMTDMRKIFSRMYWDEDVDVHES